MNTRQCYRYLFSFRTFEGVKTELLPKFYLELPMVDLSEEEKKNIRTFFSPFSTTIEFKFIFDFLYLSHLAATLECEVSYRIHEDLDQAFEKINAEFNYFTQNLPISFQKNIRNLFKQAYCVLILLGSEFPYQDAYKMVVLFGEENEPEKMFAAFDKYCPAQTSQIQNVSEHEEALKSAFDFELVKWKPDNSINLGHWRNFLNLNQVVVNIRVLAIADVLENILHRPPVSLEEAQNAASQRKFEKAEKAPELARFCCTHFVPEEYFKSILPPENRKENVKRLLNSFPMELRLNCFKSFASNMLPFDDLLSLADEVLSPDLLKKFIIEYITILETYCRNVPPKQLFARIKSQHGQAFLFEILREEYFKLSLKNHAELIATGQQVHVGLRERFLLSIIDDIKNIYVGEKFPLRNDVAWLLHPHQVTGFKYELLTPCEREAEQKLYKLQKQIATFDFQITSGGVKITLDDKSEKLVPTGVAKQWELLKKARYEVIPLDNAWNEIKNIGVAAASLSSSPLFHIQTYLSRSNNTVTYYEQFLDKEKPRHSTQLKHY